MSFLRSSIVVSLLTFISRVFGLFRDLFIANAFGTTDTADCVNVAFRLPNLFRRIFAEGAISATLVPMLHHYKDPKDKYIFITNTMWLLTYVLITLVLGMIIFMPYLLGIIAPGFEDIAKSSLCIKLCRLSMPYLILISLAAFFGSLLNAEKKFASFAFVPVLLNLSIIFLTPIFALYLDKADSIIISMIAGGFFQLLWMLAAAWQLFTLQSWFPFIKTDVVIFWKKFVPSALGSSFLQLNLFISQSIASIIPGAVSIIAYADRLYQFPLSLIGTTLTTILLPQISQMYANKSNDIVRFHNKAVKFSLLISIPSAIGLIIIAEQVINIIYEHGLFNSSDRRNTANVLIIFALGIPAYILSRIYTTIFYANLDTKTPMQIAISSLVIGVITNFLLVKLIGTNGIAISSTICGWYSAISLIICAKRYIGRFNSIKIFFKIILASILMGCVVQTIVMYYGSYYYEYDYFFKIMVLLIEIIAAIFTYALLVLSLKLLNI